MIHPAVMRSSVTLGRIRGIEVGINWSWLIVFGLIVWSLAAAVFPESNPGLADGVYVAMAIAATLLFFIALLLHELGHATQAQREGMKIEGITLWVFGGVARFSGMFPSAGAEFRIAIAGPAVTAVIATVLLVTSSLVPLPAAVDGVVAWLGNINFFLLAFNMLPAFPLDGGRVLRSALWRFKGDFAWATHAAGRIGRAFGQLMIGAGVAMAFLLGAPGGIWLALIGWFLITAAYAETQMVALREAFEGLRVADIMVREPVSVPDDASLQDVADETFPPHRYVAYPVVDGAGTPAGLLPFRNATAVPQSRWDEVRVRDVKLPLAKALVFDPGKGLGDAVAELVQTDPGRALVVRDGRLEGLLSITDAERLVEARGPRRQRARTRTT
jgi:Zn-dependent protease/CBS domain-containing protein